MQQGVIAARAKISEGKGRGGNHLVAKVIVMKHGRRRERRKRRSAEGDGSQCEEWGQKHPLMGSKNNSERREVDIPTVDQPTT